jgi:N-acetyl-anhydromuramyl-L-alanine amidase AmpD
MARSWLSAARGNLIIGGQTFHVDAPVINWKEGPRWNALSQECIPTENDPNPPCKPGGVPYSPPAGYGTMPVPYNRYSYRPALMEYYRSGRQPNYDQTKKVIKQFVVHHDGCSSADMCFSVLQNERGNSVHFLLDNDGTIFQTCDLAIMAYHAGAANTSAIGVEICNRADAKTYPGFYDAGKYGPKREVKPCKINGHTILAYENTPAQYDAFRRLCRALARLLPNLPAEYPQSSPGVQSWDTLAPATWQRFSGYMAHYHVTQEKWDPGSFDFKKFTSELRGTFSFPIFTKDDSKRTATDRPVVPEKSEELQTSTTELYKLNEQRADGGYFPVGPWGESRLWHGGVHLVAQQAGEKAPVFAPFPGRLVAARQAASTAIGSVNFVLLRHDMALGQAAVRFYSLYMHLADEQGATVPEWMTKAGKIPRDQVVLLDEPIDAGALIGHVGKAGPADLQRPQIHVEFFATKKIFFDIPNAPWKLIDGTSGGRFCEATEVNANIDTDHDGTLSHQELASFFAGGSASSLHYLVTFHVSEWTAEPNWAEALRVPKDFKKYKPAEIDTWVAEQITPALWWDAKTAEHCGLPLDGVVYHYHPVTFLGWFNQQLLDGAAADGGAAGRANEKDAKAASTFGLTDDREGGNMRSTVEQVEDPCNKRLGLDELSQGFDAPGDCAP